MSLAPAAWQSTSCALSCSRSGSLAGHRVRSSRRGEADFLELLPVPLRYTLPIRSRISRWTSGGYSLPFLEQVIPARLIAPVSDKTRGRIPCRHPSALQSLGNLIKAPVTHKAVVRVSTRPKHDRPS